jgi:hypothetical protein
VRRNLLRAVDAATAADADTAFEALGDAYWWIGRERHTADVRRCVEDVSEVLARFAELGGRLSRRRIQAAIRNACSRLLDGRTQAEAHHEVLAISERRDAIAARPHGTRGFVADFDPYAERAAVVHWKHAALVALTAEVIDGLEEQDGDVYLLLAGKGDCESNDEEAAACWSDQLNGSAENESLDDDE